MPSYVTGLVLTVSTFLIIRGLSQQDPTQIKIPQGLLQGKKLLSREGKTFYGFMGVPFAKKPERFEPAAYPPATWEGAYDATNYRTQCLQVNFTQGHVEGDEDCLWINVFTPNPTGNLSVKAFIHGGGFKFGYAFENGPEFLLDHDVVFVTFNYRLAALGFLSTGDEVLPGNLGLKDQNLALQWIRDNIQYFGGNKEKVTLSGESAGSASVSLHIVSPLSAGLFQQAICQSGSSLDRWPVNEDPKRAAVKLAEKLGCPVSSTEQLMECVKTKTSEEIIKVEITSSFFETGVSFGPVIESANSPSPRFLTEDPRKIYEEGRFNRVPLIITVNELEGLILNALSVLMNPDAVDAMNNDWDNVASAAFLFDKESYSNASKLWVARKVREHYFGSKLVGNDTLLNLTDAYSDSTFIHRAKKTALAHAKFAPVYTAVLAFKGIWSQSFDMGFREVISMTHADDLPYLFTNYRYPIFPPGSDVEEFSKLLTRLWVEFANTGEPNFKLNGRKWEPVTEEEISVGRVTWLVLRNQPEFVEEPFKDRILLWDRIDEVLETGVIPRNQQNQEL